MSTAIAPIAPALGPGVGTHLTPRQEFAILARILHQVGYDDGLAGHITVRQPDDTFLVNPFAIGWDELRASQVAVTDIDGNHLEGPYKINAATELHFALHRTRPVQVAIHNHPRWASTWSSHRRVPPCYDQTSAVITGTIALVTEYDGVVNDPMVAQRTIEAMGNADMALLANHGVLVTADSVSQAVTRARTLETRCRNAWQVEAMGSGGKVLPPEIVDTLQAGFARLDGVFPNYFEYMARRVIAADPAVLE
ncbi:MAG TPA: class II aldolase/adducin family protein [Jatrophihabitantaceae bacterium]|jgi:ribulose-5-phosphate 4-epimerase/fuculose-1-phosphate aldolase